MNFKIAQGEYKNKINKIMGDEQSAIAAGFERYATDDKKAFALECELKKRYQKLISLVPVPEYAQGGSFVTNGPQYIKVGDNPGGRERVDVTPLSSVTTNHNRSISFAGANFNFTQAIDGKRFIAELEKYSERTNRRVFV
jgi:hypothetical protein